MQINYKALRDNATRIMQLEELIERQREQMESATSAYEAARVQTTLRDVRAAQVAQIDEWEREIDALSCELGTEQRVALDAFAQLPRVQCAIMTRRYINRQDWGTIERELCYSHSYVMKSYRDARRRISAI